LITKEEQVTLHVEALAKAKEDVKEEAKA